MNVTIFQNINNFYLSGFSVNIPNPFPDRIISLSSSLIDAFLNFNNQMPSPAGGITFGSPLKQGAFQF